jgi:hypothetical protein
MLYAGKFLKHADYARGAAFARAVSVLSFAEKAWLRRSCPPGTGLFCPSPGERRGALNDPRKAVDFIDSLQPADAGFCSAPIFGALCRV